MKNCLRCNYKWLPKNNKIPKVCPKCHNPNWDKRDKKRICKGCNKRFISHKEKKYCSEKCRSKNSLKLDYLKNKDKRLEYSRGYYEQNKESRLAYSKGYRQEHKEEEKARTKKWIKANRKRYNKLMQLNYQRNKFKQKARNKARRNVPIPDIFCQKCGLKPAKERHHSDYSNPLDVIFICKPCHELIHHSPEISKKI